MEIFNNPEFNAVLTGLMVYFTSVLTNNGYPLLGAILTTFPVGIMAMLTVKNLDMRNKFLENVLTGNIIVVLTWLNIYYYSKNTSNDFIAITGIGTWIILSFIYFTYLYFK